MSDERRGESGFPMIPTPGDAGIPIVRASGPDDRDELYIPISPPARHRPRTQLPIALFVLTCVSTFLVGAFGNMPLWPPPLFVRILLHLSAAGWRQWFLNGLTYSSCVMLILLAHEFGHYLQARRYRVPASLPYFIPFPISPFGTMGAVIVQQAGVADRKSMFDIAISGPIAGLVVALPMVYFGLQQARIEPIGDALQLFGDPLIIKWMTRRVLGEVPPGSDVILNPVLFAGWVGIFITALNLIPVGQLDGGHILYCLVGRKSHYVARALFGGAILTVVYQVYHGNTAYGVWTLMLLLIWLTGTRHPPTSNDRVPLGPVRIILGWLTLLFIFIGFSPTPIYDNPYRDQPRRQIHRQPSERGDV